MTTVNMHYALLPILRDKTKRFHATLTGKLNNTYFKVKLHLEIDTSVSSRKVTVKN